MPWTDIATRFVLGFLAVSVAGWLYVNALLWVGKRFRGIGKTLLALPLYAGVAAVLVGALMYLYSVRRSFGPDAQWQHDLVLALSALCVVAPLVWYLRLRLPELRAAGFFLPRHRTIA